MAAGFDSFDRSPLGAFIRSPLGARGGASQYPYLIASVHADTSSSAALDERFQFFAASSAVDPDPIVLGYLDGADVDADNIAAQTISNIGTYRSFDAAGGFSLVALRHASLNRPDGFVVFDAAGAELWRVSGLGLDVSGPVLVRADADWTVVWSEKLDDAPDGERLVLQRRAALDGATIGATTVQLLSDISGALSLSVLVIAPQAGRAGLVWTWSYTTASETEYQLETATPAGAVDDSITRTDDPYGELAVAPDGTVYTFVVGGDLVAYDQDLARAASRDFDLSTSAAMSWSHAGAWAVVNDLLYNIEGGGTSFWLNVFDTSGALVRSVRGGSPAVAGIAWRTGGAATGTLQLGGPVSSASDDTFETGDTTYSRGVITAPYAGDDDDMDIALVSGPPTSSITGAGVVQWTPASVDAPVVDAHGADSGTAGVPYVSGVTCTPSNVDGDTLAWEVSAQNLNGTLSPNATWQTTVATEITWDLVTAPAGMFVNPISNSQAQLVWVAPTAGAHTVTVRATSHAGNDTDTFTLTVT